MEDGLINEAYEYHKNYGGKHSKKLETPQDEAYVTNLRGHTVKKLKEWGVLEELEKGRYKVVRTQGVDRAA